MMSIKLCWLTWTENDQSYFVRGGYFVIQYGVTSHASVYATISLLYIGDL